MLSDTWLFERNYGAYSAENKRVDCRAQSLNDKRNKYKCLGISESLSLITRMSSTGSSSQGKHKIRVSGIG